MSIKISGEWSNVAAGATVVEAITKGAAQAFREATGEDMPTGFGNWSFRKNKITKAWEYGIEMEAARKAIAKAKAPVKEAPAPKAEVPAGMDAAALMAQMQAMMQQFAAMQAAASGGNAPAPLSLPQPIKGRGRSDKARVA